MVLSAEVFQALNKRFKRKTKHWLELEQNAQLNRHQDSTLMDIYDTTVAKGMVGGWICVDLSMLTDAFSSIRSRSPAEIDVGRGRRSVHAWPDIMDCIWH